MLNELNQNKGFMVGVAAVLIGLMVAGVFLSIF